MRIAVLLFLLLPALAGFGHDSPEHVIEDISKKLKSVGPRHDLYYQRAIEYRALRKYPAAAADLQRAIKLQPNSATYCSELALTYSLDKKNDKALKQINLCLERWKEPGMFMARAEIYMALGKPEQALLDCEKAFEGTPQLEWHLTRSRIEAAAGRHELRIRHLKEAIESTGSGLLQIELIEAKLDAGKYLDALKSIEPELHASRWKSSWLIRRSRALKGIGEQADAEGDLRLAIHELESRLASREEAGLLADIALAHAMLGENKSARKYLARATKLGLAPSTAAKIEKVIAGS